MLMPAWLFVVASIGFAGIYKLLYTLFRNHHQVNFYGVKSQITLSSINAYKKYKSAHNLKLHAYNVKIFDYKKLLFFLVKLQYMC